MPRTGGSTRTPAHQGGQSGELHSVAAIAERADVDRKTVYRWIHGGRLSAVNIGRPGGRKRLKVADAAWAEFVRANTLPALSPPATPEQCQEAS